MAEANSTPRSKLPQDLTGMPFGRLVVLRKDPDRKWYWICRCGCGAIKSIRKHSLLAENGTRSCGCLSRERSRKQLKTHGMSRTPIYNCWWGITYRGQNKSKEPCYTTGEMHICKRWRESFEAFYSDMGDKPSYKHSIDRIDRTGGYTCGKCEECLARGDKPNCRWATKQEQSVNRSVTHFLTLNGETLHLREWARRLGTTSTTLLNRLKRGMSDEEALSKPISHKPYRGPRLLTANGETRTLAEWSRSTGLSMTTISCRLEAGWSEAGALTKPSGVTYRHLSHNGETHSIAEWSRITGLREDTIGRRLVKGRSVSDALTKPVVPPKLRGRPKKNATKHSLQAAPESISPT